MVKKLYCDASSEMTVTATKENKFIFEIGESNSDSLITFQSVELNTEDVLELINDLEYYIESQKK